MDRIELDEQIEAQQYEDSKKTLLPLFGPQRPVYQRKATKGVYTANQALGQEIWPLMEPYKDIPPLKPKPSWRPFTYSALLGIIAKKGPTFIRQTYRLVKLDFEEGKITNPLAIFLWKIGRTKVELTEV